MRTFGLDGSDPESHFMNDGVLSPEFQSAPSDYFRFSVVRNPWDRFVSGWKYLTSTRGRSLLDVLNNLPKEGHDYRHLTRPQHAILYDKNGKLIVDYLIRFESLQQGFDDVCRMIGKPRRKLPHVNPSNRTHYSDYFDEETQKLFLPHFSRDIELFGYEY